MVTTRTNAAIKILSVILVFVFATFNIESCAFAQSEGSAGQMQPDMPKPGNVTVNFKDVDILSVLNYLSEVSGVDIVPSPGVDAVVTMKLRDKPWEVALDIVTRNYGYVYSREGNIIRVVPKSKLQMEEAITEVIPLNYVVEDTEGKEKNITKLMEAVTYIIDERAGEKATFLPSANAMVVTTIPTRMTAIKEMVNKVDKKTPQIMLEAKVIEITLDRNDQFGVDWNAVVTAAGAQRPTTFPFTNTGILNFLPGEQRRYFPTDTTGIDSAVFPLTDTTPISAVTVAEYFQYGTLDFSTFTATLRLIDEWDNTNIISSPRITTLNNQTAVIKVITNLYLQKQQKTTDTATTVTVEFEKDPREIGVILEVTPHVNDRGEIAVNLKPEVSSDITFQTLEVQGGNQTQALRYNTRSADTQIMVKDGETIFIGGLISETITKEDHKLPILGDLFGGIPVIGSAFKYEQDNKDKTEVVFFVTVHLLKDGVHSIKASDTVDEYNKHFPKKEPIILQGQVKSVEHQEEIAVAAAEEKKYKPFLDFRKK